MNKRKKSLAVFSSVFLLVTVILGFIKDIALIQFDMQNYETNLIKGHILGIVYLSISLVWAILLFIFRNKPKPYLIVGGICLLIIGLQDFFNLFKIASLSIGSLFFSGFAAVLELTCGILFVIQCLARKKRIGLPITMVCLAGLLASALFGPGDLSATVRILKAPQAPLFVPNLLDNLHIYFWALAVLFISIFMLTVENEAEPPINPIRVQEV